MKTIPFSALLTVLLTFAPARAQPPVVDFDVNPTSIESIGLTLNLPLDADASTSWAGRLASVRVIPSDATWIIEIKAAEPKDPDTTPEVFADSIIASLKHANGGAGLVFNRTGLHRIGGRPADAFSFEFPRIADEPVKVYSYAVVINTPQQVVTFTLITTKPEFERASIAFQGMLKTAAFSDPMLVEAERAAAVANTERLLANLTEEDLNQILTGKEERWRRLYKPADSMHDADAAEYGYQRFRSWRGKRGEMDPKRDRSRWSAADHDNGILVRIDARLLEPTHMIDSSSVCFISDERDEEAWNTVAAIKSRDGDERPSVWREIGARSGLNLTVRVEGAGLPTETVTATIPTQGYLSQVESLLLSEMLVRGADKTTYGGYVYRPARNAIQYRGDEVQRLENGRVQITSVHEQGQEPTVGLFAADGALLSQALDRGRFWEPIELQRLVTLWRSKNLPMD